MIHLYLLEKFMKKSLFALMIGLASIHGYANDELSFEIRKASSINPYQVALVPFANDNIVTNIINNNLSATDVKSTSQNLPAYPNSHANFAQSQLAFHQADFPYVVTGAVSKLDNNKTAIVFEVIEVSTGRVVGGRQTQIADSTPDGLRYASHVVSDKIYELITGIPGDFSGRIAFVEETGDLRNKISTLKVMDADGQNVVALYNVQGSIFSPAWSPDGKYLAYAVQKNNGLPVIYLQNIDGGSPQLITPFKGNNLGASFSPDGSSILFSGSHENNDPAIYQLHIASGQLKKLTHMTGAENSPSYSPDGRSFVFTADNGSRTPTLHRYDFNSGQISRLGGGSAANPRFAPDGKKIAYVAGSTLTVLNLGGASQAIAPTSTHESASFSPNATRIAYSSGQTKGAITIRSLTTGQSFTKTAEGRVKDPAWSANRK